MSGTPGTADMRGFQWRLAALERKLDHDLGRAHSALAVLQREAADLDTLRNEMADLLAAQMRGAAGLIARKPDPAAHRACLRYLQLGHERLHQRRSEADELAARVSVARQACLDADRKLAALRSLRHEQETEYATEQSRRGAREADLAWLANAFATAQAAARREESRP